MSSAATDDAAARWIARRESGSWTAEDEAEFNTWLEASTSNRVSYLRLHATWDKTATLRLLTKERATVAVPQRGSWDWSRVGNEFAADPNERHFPDIVTGAPKNKTRLIAALAAACVLGAVGLYVLSSGVFSAREYSTAVGKSEVVRLLDGSQATLNTDSRVRVSFGRDQRLIALKQGEVFFEVAKDVRRPFVVQAGDAQVIAVGTQFCVRREPANILVVVTEGTVRVKRTNPHSAETAGDPSGVPVTAGNVARITADGTAVRTQRGHEIERMLSWRKGYVSFENATLQEAVAEFNRYSTQRIVVQDPSIADLRLSGNFRTNNLDGFLSLLQDGFNVRVEENGSETSLRSDEQ